MQSGHRSGNAAFDAAHRARDLFLAELGVERDERLMARARSAELADLQRAQQATAGRLVTPFKPVIDGDVLPSGVLDLFAGGVQQPVTLLLGTNQDKHNLFAANGWGHGTGHTAPLRERLQGMIIDGDPATADNLAASYAKLAAGAAGGWSPNEAAWNIVRTDLDWRGPQRGLALVHADAGAPVYRYEFALRSTAECSGRPTRSTSLSSSATSTGPAWPNSPVTMPRAPTADKCRPNARRPGRHSSGTDALPHSTCPSDRATTATASGSW
ncbi:carboxylesterase family protein [Streptomyces sp. NPDC001027]|uniref:carboxylesterase family protein n=1 Tax=Streptomyces sp. NPDC001027 TaxID=3154771 RepID=UPI00331B64A8